MQPPRIRSKADFVTLWNNGALGNKLRTWTDWREIPRDFPFPVMCRPLLAGRVIREATAEQIHRTPYLQSGWHYNECAPDHMNTLQGELRREHFGLLFWGAEHSGVRMREMLATQAKHFIGAAVGELLKKHCSPASYDDVMELLDLYPDHNIELTAYSRDLGWSRGRNTIIWEVRQY